ncbi:MAG: C40 family peptidase [Lachnospiraceae bacterium]|nr:C40 family peptidase [Lachnospiraceae bacterium]
MKKTIIRAASIASAIVIGMTGIPMASSANTLSSVLPKAGVDYTLNPNSKTLSTLKQESEKEKKVASEKAGLGNTAATKAATSQATEKAVETVQSISETTLESAGTGTESIAESISETLPVGVDPTLTAAAASAVGSSSSTKETEEATPEIKDTVIVSELYEEGLAEAVNANIESEEEEGFKNLVIAQVNNYVNVRSGPSEDYEVVGKLYDDSVGTYVSEENGWYKITSGTVTGYVKGEFCVTGDAAVDLAKQVGKRIATVNTTTLKVRDAAGLDAEVLGLVPEGDQLLVDEELDGWVKVNIEEGDGFVSKDYVVLSTEFVTAESKAEEEARLAREEEELRKAREAAAKKSGKKSESSYKDTGSYAVSGSGTGTSVANYALQFVGNPYVYGGTSLTKGADCSGFVMSVYSHFGVSLPHSSSADRSVGATVSSLSEAQAGDIVCYSGHVGIYIGGGQIVHASTARTGIKVSSAGYRRILSIRRIF